MPSKIKLKEFLNLKECESFVNNFSAGKEAEKKEVIPITLTANGRVVKYLTLIEYKEESNKKARRSAKGIIKFP